MEFKLFVRFLTFDDVFEGHCGERLSLFSQWLVCVKVIVDRVRTFDWINTSHVRPANDASYIECTSQTHSITNPSLKSNRFRGKSVITFPSCLFRFNAILSLFFFSLSNFSFFPLRLRLWWRKLSEALERRLTNDVKAFQLSGLENDLDARYWQRAL